MPNSTQQPSHIGSPLIVFVTGVTCTGKSSFLIYCSALKKEIGVVEVGKELRKKYPPDYFEGSGAPKKTEKEAMKICLTGIGANIEQGKKIILVDGQPRRESQVSILLKNTAKYKRLYLELVCSEEEQLRRMKLRFPNDKESLQLAQLRFYKDKVDLAKVKMEMLIQVEIHPTYINTEAANWDQHVLNYILGVQANAIADSF